MLFGRKARLLAELVGRSNNPNKPAILGALNKIRGNSMRDIIAHAYQHSTENTVTFVERSISGEFRAKEHKFTRAEFVSHLKTVGIWAEDFYNALGINYDDLQLFAKAALSLNRKSATSPGAPKESA